MHKWNFKYNRCNCFTDIYIYILVSLTFLEKVLLLMSLDVSGFHRWKAMLKKMDEVDVRVQAGQDSHHPLMILGWANKISPTLFIHQTGYLVFWLLFMPARNLNLVQGTMHLSSMSSWPLSPCRTEC